MPTSTRSGSGGSPGRVRRRLPARDQRPGGRLPLAYVADPRPGAQEKLVDEALRRATAYLEAGVDCVYPIVLWETDPLRHFMSEISGPVNITRMQEGPAVAELAELGVARVSWALYLYWDAMARFKEQLATLQS
jgi:2-methylisocitrate lyase-like PEP mutase family enzyme